MRTALFALPIAAAAVLATPALAQPYRSTAQNYAAPAAGVVVGTVAGVGTYNAWWGSGAFASALPASAAGAAVVGGVAGVGTIALIDAVVQPCRGFHAIFGLNKDVCVNGEYVGDQPRRMSRR